MISTATDDANSMMRSVVVELNLILSNSIYPRYLVIAFILVTQNTMSGGCCLLIENK